MGVVKPTTQQTVRQFEVYLTRLNPTTGSEIKKMRPCLIISPDELNLSLRTVIIAPMTTKSHSYPYRVSTRFAQKKGEIALDQMRSIDKSRLLKHLGNVDAKTAQQVLQVLINMFQPS